MSTSTLLLLAESLNKDLADRAYDSVQNRRRFRVEVSKDIQTLRRRFLGEGDALFTIALPRLGKHFLVCLEEGSFSPLPGWKFRKGTKLPCFMHGWFERIFCPETGSMLEHVQPDAVYCVRQLLSFAGKAKELPSEKACRKAVLSFQETEDAIPQTLWSKSISIFGYSSEAHDDLHLHVDHHWRDHDIYGQYFLASARTIGFEVLRGYSPELLRPKHGPGAVAERLRLDGKWLSVTDHRSRILSSVFCTDWTERPFFAEGEDYGNGIRLAEANPASRLILVPKTAVTPRLIAAEPTVNQFWQQALLGWMADRFGSTWLKSCIDMRDQTRSQELAREGSTNGSLCTIDLSEASDTVTLDHVGALFPPGPFLQAVMACRTQRIELPDGGKHCLKKFATMGSAVCFPIESLVFLAACAAGVLVSRNLKPTTRNIVGAAQACTVYGDDLIVPNDCAIGVIAGLTSLGFKPNVTKTFYRSKFRESCGGDFFKGEPVKPVYLREIPSGRVGTHNTVLMSLCAFARQLHDQGCKRTRTRAFKYISHVLNVPRLPYSSSLDGFVSHNVREWDNGWELRYNSRLHRWEFVAYATKPSLSKLPLHGTARLLYSLDALERRRRGSTGHDGGIGNNALMYAQLGPSSGERYPLADPELDNGGWRRSDYIRTLNSPMSPIGEITTLKGVRLVRKWIPNPYLPPCGDSAE